MRYLVAASIVAEILGLAWILLGLLIFLPLGASGLDLTSIAILVSLVALIALCAVVLGRLMRKQPSDPIGWSAIVCCVPLMVFALHSCSTMFASR